MLSYKLKEDLNFYFVCKKTFFVSLPIIITNIISAAIGITSMYFLSLTGYEGLAAGALISSTYAFITTCAFSILSPIGILTSQKYLFSGQLEILKVIHQGLIYAALISIPVICIMKCVFPILIIFKQPLAIAKIVAEYFNVISYGILPTLCNMAISQFLVGISMARFVVYYSGLSFLLFTGLTYVFLYGKFGAPRLEVIGIAYAISLTSWVSFIASLIYLKVSQKFNDCKIFPIQLYPSKSLLWNLFSMGWPVSLQYGAEILALMIMTYLIGMFGKSALVAQQITLQCSMVPILIVAGFSQATSVLIGNALGRNNLMEVKQQYFASLLLVMIFNLLLALIFIFFPHQLISIFLKTYDQTNLATIQLAILFLEIVAISRIFDGIKNITTGALRGYNDARFAMLTTLTSYWLIAFPISILLIFHYGAAGVRLGYLLGVITGTVILVLRFCNCNAPR